MTGKVFGRRNTAPVPASPPIPLMSLQSPDADGATRVFSKRLFDDPTCEMLRGLGFTPDDPWNVVKTPEQSAQARTEAATASQIRFVAQLNANLPFGIEVIPWPLIPRSLWAGEHASFLTDLVGLVPASPDNTMLLAADQLSALSLKLPEFPNTIPAGVEYIANQRLAVMSRVFETERQKHVSAVNTGLAQRDVPVLIPSFRPGPRFLHEVVLLAQSLGSLAFGQTAWERHQSLFAKTLNPQSA